MDGLSSTVASDASAEDTVRHSSIQTRVCLVGNLVDNEDIKKKLLDLKIPFVTSQAGVEYAYEDDPYFETIFVLEQFEGDVFNNLKSTDNRILGPPVINAIAETNEPLPYTSRPLYCPCMQGLYLCLANFRVKGHMSRIVELCHYMGAYIKKEMTPKINFLITNSLQGGKYRKAVSLGIPVVNEDWVHRCWSARHRATVYSATDDEFLMPCKVKPFNGCVLSFLGFSETETKHMEEQAKQQGGEISTMNDDNCTHLVVEENSIKTLPISRRHKLHVVMQEWFWGSIQIEAKAEESMYVYEDDEKPKMMTRSSTTSSLLGTPRYRSTSSNYGTTSRSSGRSFSRKRSRLREETLAKLAQDSDQDTPNLPRRKRQSTEVSACVGSDSMFDYSSGPVLSPGTPDTKVTISAKAKPASARYHVICEFLQTETNYVDILNTILTLFKKPLDDPEQAGGSILATEDVKAIFGSLPEIAACHRLMKTDLEDVVDNWSENSCVGDTVSKYAKDMLKSYPPFVNFFETSKETIESCEARFPRFHAFLKINQSKKECGRQTLAQLLINPVQRVPRIILLLQDIKKHTEKEDSNHPDIVAIQNAISSFKKVMTYINEDKRKTESQRQMFDIVHEIDGCPPTILSSHRRFVARAEMIAVDDKMVSKGDHVTLFIFTDCIEMAKRRRSAKNTSVMRSPNVSTRSNAEKLLKHVKFMSLSHIKKVVDITNSENCQDAIAFFCRTPDDVDDWLCSFKVMSCSDDVTKTSDQECGDEKENISEGKQRLIRILKIHRANAICKASDDNFVHLLDPRTLEITTTDLGGISRAVRYIFHNIQRKASTKQLKNQSFTSSPFLL